MPCYFNDSSHYTPLPGNLFLARLHSYKPWPTGIASLASPRFTLYPNPSQGSCTLSLPQAMQGSYTLYDMAGRALQQYKLLPTQTDYTIHTTMLSPGVYLLELSTSQGRQSQKLVVE